MKVAITMEVISKPNINSMMVRPLWSNPRLFDMEKHPLKFSLTRIRIYKGHRHSKVFVRSLRIFNNIA